jgi:hypothetical protein
MSRSYAPAVVEQVGELRQTDRINSVIELVTEFD